MNLSTKILIFIGVCLALILGTIIVVKQFEIANLQKEIETNVTAQKELVDGITRSMGTLASQKDLSDFAKQSNIDLNKIKSDLELVNGNVIAINKVTFDSKGYTSSEKGTNGVKNPNPINPTIVTCKDGSTTTCPTIDQYGYIKTQQSLDINEHFGENNVPFGKVGFSAWKEKPFDLSVYDRSYNAVNVIGQDSDGRHYAYSKISLDVNGKTYDIKINKAELKEEYPSDSFSFFNPQLFMGVAGSIDVTSSPVKGEFTPTLTLGIMSYGKTKTNPFLSVLHVGVGYATVSQRPMFVVNPVNFNIGSALPGNLVRNTYVGPTLQVNTAGSVFFGGTVTVGF
jgi:cell division protein FtsL